MMFPRGAYEGRPSNYLTDLSFWFLTFWWVTHFPSLRIQNCWLLRAIRFASMRNQRWRKWRGPRVRFRWVHTVRCRDRTTTREKKNKETLDVLNIILAIAINSQWVNRKPLFFYFFGEYRLTMNIFIILVFTFNK